MSGPAGLAVALAFVAFASPLAAQTLPLPTFPPEPASEAPSSESAPPDGSAGGADVGGPEAPTRQRPWEYSLGIGALWDANIDFLPEGGPDGFALAPRGGLARVFSAGHNRLRASAAGGWTGYPNQSDLNRSHGDFDLDGRYRPSPKTDLRLNASYELGYGDTSQVLMAQGLLLPAVRTQSVFSALRLSRRLTRWTSFRLGGRFYRTTFDSPTLVDGRSLRATAALDRAFSVRSNVAVEYALENVFADERGRAYLTHFGSVQWTRTLAPRSALLLEAGASYTPDAARAGLERERTFFGGVSFNRQVKRSNVMLFVRREVTPAFGLGLSRLELRAGLTAAVPLGRSWVLRMSGSHAQPVAVPTGEQAFGTTDDAFVALGRQLGRRLEVAAEARYRRSAAIGAVPLVDAFQSGITLTVLTPSWRDAAPAPGR